MAEKAERNGRAYVSFEEGRGYVGASLGVKFERSAVSEWRSANGREGAWLLPGNVNGDLAVLRKVRSASPSCGKRAA